jgi:beta-lactamase class A
MLIVMRNKKSFVKASVFISVVAVFFVAGFLTSTVRNSSSNTKYPLIARRAQADNPNELHVNFSPLRTSLESYISGLAEDSDKVSVYFEYLPTGVSININETNESIAASLMKVPTVMTLYHAAREGKIDLDKKVKLKQEWLNDEYGSLYKKGVGYEISLREAAELTLKDSDNTAILLIFDELDELANEDSNITKYLDLEYEVNSDERVLIGARSYSSIMKCLYFACYNTNEDSQEILSYLTESVFDNRLELQLPDDLQVAHKIGTFSTKFQSDCGIFYVPDKNYLLCVMVEGEDPKASAIISTISTKVYQYISTKVTTTE